MAATAGRGNLILVNFKTNQERISVKMKKLIAAALSVMLIVGLSCAAIAGSLDSPGAPSSGSGMYTLQNLYDYLTSGTALTVQTSFQEPTSGPTAGTMKTTKQIGDAIKALLDQSDVGRDNVESGKRFFCTQPGSWGIQTGTLSALPRPTATPTATITPTPTGTPTPFLASCKAIKDANSSASDGVYTIDPSGTAPFQTYCDMTTDGGGWTLVLTRKNSGTIACSESTFNAAFGTNLTDPAVNADNAWKGEWSSMNFTEVRYQLGNSYLSFYFTGINTQTMRNNAKTALWTPRISQGFWPDCTSQYGGGTTYIHCGNTDHTAIEGWVSDPIQWCWYADCDYSGGGGCPGSQAGGYKGRIWVK